MFFKKSSIEIKTKQELEKMKVAGRIVGEILSKLSEIIKPGITTKEIDSFSEKYIRSLKVKPAFLGYNGFPATACVSVNDEVVHGIPNASRVLKEGDIVSVDMGVIYEGYYGDYEIGRASCRERV